MPFLAGTVVVLGFAAACMRAEREAGTGEPSVVSDSAGVRIIESFRQRWSAEDAWQVQDAPEVVIGSVDGDAPYTLTSVSDAVRLADGRILVAEGASTQLRLFDAMGRHMVTFGGEGEGPGDFRDTPAIVLLPGDTVLSFDLRNSRYTVFSSEGQLIRTERFETQAMEQHFAGTGLLARDNSQFFLFPDGSLFHAAGIPPRMQYRQDPSGVLRLVTDEMADYGIQLSLVFSAGREVRILGRYPSYQRGYVVGEGNPRNLWVENPFYPLTPHAVGPGPGYVHIGTPGEREVRTFGPDGHLNRIVRQRRPRRPVTSDGLRAFHRMVRETAAFRDVPSSRASALVDRMAVPDSMYPYLNLTVDGLGNLWAEENLANAGSPAHREFNVIDSEGAWLGSVFVTREAGHILEIGDDYLLSVSTDTLGVPFLRLHRIMKPLSQFQR